MNTDWYNKLEPSFLSKMLKKYELVNSVKHGFSQQKQVNLCLKRLHIDFYKKFKALQIQS